jgi:hypothetical protein
MTVEVQSHGQQIADFWGKAISEQMQRTESFYAEVAKLETKGTEQALANLDEMNRLTRETIAYAGQLSAAWGIASLDATRRAFEIISAKK